MKLDQVDTNSRHNNFNIVRLVAAISVTFAHSFSLLYGKDITLLGMNSGYFGSMAVAVFFTLSGYLITQSYCRHPRWKDFLKARVLRIFPGLFFANFITILLVGLFVKHQGLGLFLDTNNLAYLFNATIFKTYNYGEAFPLLPFTAANGSLWTLPVEFRMYLFVLLLGVIGFLHKRLWAAVVLGALALAAIFKIHFVGEYIFPHLFDFRGFGEAYLVLAMSFGLGMIYYLFKDKVRLSLIAATLAVLVVYFAHEPYLKYLFMSYVALVIGVHPKIYLRQLNFKDDISYGVYVLSFPIQQTLIHTKMASTPMTVFFMTMAIVIPLSIFSWRKIEKPALRFKKSAKNSPV